MHPPGGATALAAVIGGQNIHALGYRISFSNCNQYCNHSPGGIFI
ncbi:MAG: hypothetical protein DSY94_03185 [SAR324 cluster bacterium]|uniref:HPP transmembrane region domain-containing protein n=1 Tax=SAR324 cluster bacterium TaxID=2024889 RepID=A0A432GQF3_9DELT|nr:MAG: hypothetical protein DSY94_03185 [SAR324 cluster bacterium]